MSLHHQIMEIKEMVEQIKATRHQMSPAALTVACAAYEREMERVYPEARDVTAWAARLWRWKGDLYRWRAEREPGAGHNREAREAYRAALFFLGMRFGRCVMSLQIPFLCRGK